MQPASNFEARLSEMRRASIIFDGDGDVVGVDWASHEQAKELALTVGVDLGALPRLAQEFGSAWVYYPAHLLRLSQPSTWGVCCRLYAIDCAERSMTLGEGPTGDAHRRFLQDCRLYVRGLGPCPSAPSSLVLPVWSSRSLHAVTLSDPGAAACKASWSACRAVSAGAADLRWGKERQAQWQRLQQYEEFGPAASELPWPD
jgi:hypothetical protein